ncbi:hypothetical protein SEA_SONALI_64 [Arthrobacter phage Sonali]|uniref:Uncharacterized protein n=1 Tax=Arthrobacter phage Sonali TaxID=2510495 RepID=A0A411CQU4_9CAUD|nr:hypothetical protein HOV09_gp64 [Arthrobacter phage Sonali]QAY16176.1 hypothetical protein SEA_SONALI_64 [Arthrobacter phage Sonali]
MATSLTTNHSVTCPVCWEQVTVTTAARLTSPRAPRSATAVVFLEVDRDRLDRHLATHLTEEEAAA